jgi:hypothetical protein
MESRTLEFKRKEIECHFTYIHQHDLSLVIDIIRHYGRIVFRGFAAAGGKKLDFSRLFPFPDENDPFSGRAGDSWVRLDMDGRAFEGDFKGKPPISFGLKFAIEDYYFSSTKPGWIDRVPLLNRVYKGVDLSKGVSLLHEDFPLIKVDGNVKFAGKDHRLKGARGAIGHHWGWYFPNYLFLMCNGFEDPGTLLTLALSDSLTSLGTGIRSGYLYLRDKGRERTVVSPVQGKILYFYEEEKISVIARFDDDDFLRIQIDPRVGAAFPHIFNTHCLTVLNAVCQVEGVGRSEKAVLDVKGLDVVEMIR